MTKTETPPICVIHFDDPRVTFENQPVFEQAVRDAIDTGLETGMTLCLPPGLNRLGEPGWPVIARVVREVSGEAKFSIRAPQSVLDELTMRLGESGELFGEMKASDI